MQPRSYILAMLLGWASFSAALPVQAASPIAVAGSSAARPTIVLVHGAFADSSSWTAVAQRLSAHGYPVVSVANPLRGVQADAAYTASLVRSIAGPVVLVGHSYGGMVIARAAQDEAQVRALVFVAALAPEAGETVAGLAGKFPGSTLGTALADPVTLPDGAQELYIRQDKYWQQFAADVAEPQAAAMAVAQRPVALAALNEPAGAAAWQRLPSFFVYGTADRNLPPAVLRYMAERAHGREIREIPGASHALMASHAQQVAELIEVAARAGAPAQP
ncbi:alpha/beta fold hydrolase [Pseudoduganella danionis]|nr:alpha/beta fold hydrolase [Pseudoduganella danionis]